MNHLVEGMRKSALLTENDNGGTAYISTLSANLDLFFAIGTLGIEEVKLKSLMQRALSENGEMAIKILLYSRDIRGGLGIRRNFIVLLNELAHRKPALSQKLMRLIPELGRWDDLLAYFGTSQEARAIDYWWSMLDTDPNAAKWMPRQKSAKKDYANTIMRRIGLSPGSYRKYLSSKTDVIETKMSSNSWEDINYSHTPSVASARYQSAFLRNDEVRYRGFLSEVEDGTAKINAGAVYPHDIVRSLLSNADNGPAAGLQWSALPDYMGDSKLNILSMVDVSGSMENKVSGSIMALDIAISLGLYISERTRGSFKNLFLTFSESPELVYLTSSDLLSNVMQMSKSSWGYSTNIIKAHQLIIDKAIDTRARQEEMPDLLLILSDMQFDAATREETLDLKITSSKSKSEIISEMYEKAGYKAPTIVYWNLLGSDNFPITKNDNGLMVSGFSPKIMESVLSMQIDNISPESIMLDAISSDRYNWNK